MLKKLSGCRRASHVDGSEQQSGFDVFSKSLGDCPDVFFGKVPIILVIHVHNKLNVL